MSDDEYTLIDSLVDLPNLIDFELINMAAGNHDATPSLPLQDRRGNNWYAVAGNGHKFCFLTDDGEQTLGAVDHDPLIDRTGPYPIGAANPYWSAHYFNPGWLHEVLLTRADYRLLLRERVVALFTGGGALTTTPSLARWQSRQAEVDPLVIAEAARWGDAGGIAYTRNTWLDEVGWVVGNWFPTRTATVVGQFAAHWWRVSGIGVAEEGYAPSVRIGAGG